MRRFAVAVLLSTPLLAQSPEEWDTERRLAERFDDARNAERIAAVKAKSPNLSLDSLMREPGSKHYLIVGWRNPELFLPHELFESLLDADKSTRDSYGKKLGDFGWEAASFWTTLDELSAGYRAVRYKQRTASAAATACRARFDALERARQTFGKKKFDAFLYSALPPGMVFTTSTSEADPAASLRREALGCPEDPNHRYAWEWTIEQRLAARNVAGDRKRRVDQLLATSSAKAKSPRPYDHLQGSIRPELLLPTEIVDIFIDVLAAGDERTAQARADAVQQAAYLDLPPEFFPAFEKALAGAIATRREQSRMARMYPPGKVVSAKVAARIAGLNQDACRGSWKGIETARAAYGNDFDRFLYVAIAPKVRKTYMVPVTSETLRDQARGCP
ncbi:MAG TPA: hypothetical protein VJZ76_20880 [Thermoanaerobaculia bacterium]|nr:hypothetical protein [Thermoanaerobaculia bacterium]